MITDINRFTIRVYGLLIWKDQVLLSEEWIEDFNFTKFPGGGLEFGEGTRDCLIREFMEEANATIEVKEHFYTTDFFQQSAFRSTDQIVSVYYKVNAISDPGLISTERIAFTQHGRQEFMRFFWVPLNQLNDDLVTFPIDKHVVKMLKTA